MTVECDPFRVESAYPLRIPGVGRRADQPWADRFQSLWD
jgi:hypothetical protein